MRGLRAVTEKRVQLLRDGDNAELLKLDVFLVLAYETLRRSLPEITMSEIAEHLEVEDMEPLSTAILAANPQLAKLASEAAAGNR